MAEMAVDPNSQAKPASKLNLDEFMASAFSGTPTELHPFFQSFQTLYTKKLWHQLTVKLFEFFNHPASLPYRVYVFETFVRDFEHRLNQLKLVQMAVNVVRCIDNPERHQTFLTDLLSRLDTEKAENSDAHVLLLSTLANAKLTFNDLDGCKRDMDKAFDILDSLERVDPMVNASYYGIAAAYYKAKAEYASYYKNSLLYLACVDIDKDVSTEDKLERAHDLALSAFLADTIYNFGELLMHPILDALEKTQYEWLKRLLFTFNEGNIGKFEALTPLFPQEPILYENYSFLRQKICLMALIDAVFRRPVNNRTMTFKEISVETRLPDAEVEHLLMKAMSLKLIKGTLDQVDSKAHITWVQPRVLSRQQIGDLAKRLDEWVTRLNYVEKKISPELGHGTA